MDDNGFRRAQLERQAYYSQQQQQQQQSQNYNYPYGEGFVGQNMQQQQNTMPYQVDYAQEAQRAQQQQNQYQQFGGSVMYNMPQQPQQQPQQVFVQPYQQRQQPLVHAVPQHYFVPPHNNTTTTTTTATTTSSNAPSANAIPSQFAPIGYAQTQQQPIVERQYIASPCPQPVQEQAPPPAQASPPVVALAHDPPQMSSHVTTADPLAEAYASYQTHLLQTYEKVRDGQLAEAAVSLLDLSGWLLKNVEYLSMSIFRSCHHPE